MTYNRKHFKLFILAMFFIGLAVGAIAKTAHNANDFSNFSPLHLVLIFSSGLSLGAIITRIRNENKMEKMMKDGRQSDTLN